MILKGQIIGSRSRLADLKRKVNVLSVRKRRDQNKQEC